MQTGVWVNWSHLSIGVPTWLEGPGLCNTPGSVLRTPLQQVNTSLSFCGRALSRYLGFQQEDSVLWAPSRAQGLKADVVGQGRCCSGRRTPAMEPKASGQDHAPRDGSCPLCVCLPAVLTDRPLLSWANYRLAAGGQMRKKKHKCASRHKTLPAFF